MGLCKCPQRKVSTLFCFKHHVNVCESCLVLEHPQCIVRSYVSWLQDNDFNPNCTLCQQSLSDNDQETIRLLCYDLFHWTCLSEYLRSFPMHTAPDGYTCPTCKTCIFPAPNHASPVADQVRMKLATLNWPTKFPLVGADGSIEKSQVPTETENNGFVFVNDSGHSTSILGTSGLSHHPNRLIDPIPSSTTVTIKPSEINVDDEDKYKRRSVFTWFARWLRSRQPSHRKHPTSLQRNESSRTRSWVCTLFLIILGFLTLIIILYHLTRGDLTSSVFGRDNGEFNPLNNPFIRVDEERIKNPI